MEIRSTIPNMTFSTWNVDPLSPLSPISPKFCITNFFAWNTLFPLSQMHRRYKLIFIPLWYGELLAENNFTTKIGRGWFRGASKNFETPPYFRNHSNLVHNLGLAISIPTIQHLGPKLACVGARGASQKYWDPYVFLQPLKLATSNLVHNFGLASSLPRNNV